MNVGEMGLVRGGLLRGLWITAVGGEVRSMVDLEGPLISNQFLLQ